MKNIFKSASFFVFLLLLLALFVSVYFAQYLPLEGFISFNKNTAIMNKNVIVPPYSSQYAVTKIYDSIYFDTRNGNVLELFGKSAETEDTSGTTLTNMVLLPRNTAEVVEYNIREGNTFSSNIVESSYVNRSLASTNVSWIYPTEITTDKLVYDYQVVCYTWKTETVLLTNDIVGNKLLYSPMSSTQGGAGAGVSTIEHVVTGAINSYVMDNDPQNGKFIAVLPQYKARLGSLNLTGLVVPSHLYQVSKHVLVDASNAILVVTSDSTSDVTIYADIAQGNSQFFFAEDTTGKNVIFVSTVGNTHRFIVGVLCVDNSQQSNNPRANDHSLLTIRRTVRFDPAVAGGVDGEDAIVGAETTTAPTAGSGSGSSSGSGTGKGTTDNSNEYIKKTQIVPPVCPACPSCTCDSCRTGDGSGCKVAATHAPTSGKTLSNLIATSYTDQSYTGEGVGVATVNQLGGIVTTAENVVGNVAGGVVGGVTQLGLGAEKTVDTAIIGTTQLGLGAIGGTTQLGTAVAGDATSIANNIIDSVESIVNNAMKDLTSGGREPTKRAGAGEGAGEGEEEEESETTPTPYQPSATPMACLPGAYKGAGGPGLNQYYGALDGRPSSSFMPVTADFSKFGR